MERKKRVYCLYRVSKPEQVDNDDIPMQKQACQEFSERQGWEVVKEFYEKGVSGFKKSSKDRDAILEIQREAALGNFDILLVFMFDRLGRRDDETPFVVQWFFENGIAIWSVNEGEQRLDSHVDKLLNYIRFWQASGESIKTSVRVKAGIAQIVGEGHFAGGKAPFGYRLVKSGRFNLKKGTEVLDYALDDEATVNRVKEIFNKYVNEGYGNSRLVKYLYEQGVVKPNGKPFSQLNISRMVQNELYNGYVKRGETRTFVPALQIIDDDTFSRVQELRKMRNKSNHDRRRVPMNTKGAGLLSGNVFCGHCGRRMGFANSTVKHRNQNGEVVSYNSPGYVCRYGSRLGGSTCQQKYVSTKVDDVVRGMLQQVFEQIRETPPAEFWNKRHECAISEIENKVKTAASRLSKLNKELAEYKSEVLKAIRGESSFTADVLNPLIQDTKDKVSKQTTELELFKSELEESDTLYEKAKAEHLRIRSWSEIFDESSPEAQKMVASSLINAVRLYRGYRIEIDFNISIKEFVESVILNEENPNITIGN